MSYITNTQWHILKDHVKNQVDIIELSYKVEKRTIQSMLKKGFLQAYAGRKYRITLEAKIAVDNMNRLTERYDRG